MHLSVNRENRRGDRVTQVRRFVKVQAQRDLPRIIGGIDHSSDESLLALH